MITVQIRALLTQATGTLQDRNALTGVRLLAENATDKKAEDKKAEEPQRSANVSLSDFGKRQLQAFNMLKSLNTVQETRKAAARAQAAELKRRIDSLKAMAMMLGPLAAKGILRQIKQIAQQLRAVAAELAQPSAPEMVANAAPTTNASAGGENVSVDENVNFGAAEGDSEGEAGASGQTVPQDRVAAAAAQQEKAEAVEEEEEEGAKASDADAEAGQTAAAAGQAEQAASAAESEVKDKEEHKGVNGNEEIARQRRAQGEQARRDAKLVSDLARELRQLLGLVKSMLPRKDKEDKDNLKEIEKQLQETEKLARQLDVTACQPIDDVAALSGVETATAEVSADTAVSAASISVFA
ncbi:MAG: hypothetical protein LBQ81_10025 [Zoogloeaceae bacterium]|jgi:hypothetical protein|nr:hypothetical protein [Zoogloeaceae bacterium]